MLQSTPIFASRTKPCSGSRARGQDRCPRTGTAGRAATKACEGRAASQAHTHQPLQGSRARTRTANTPFRIELQHDSYFTQKGFPSLPSPCFRFGALDLASATVCLKMHRSREETVTSGGGASSWHRQLCQKFTTPGWCRGGVTAPLCPSHTHRVPEPAPGWRLPCLVLTSSSCTLRGISNMHICTGCTRAFCTLNKGFASIFPGMEGLLILLSLLRRSSPRSRSSPGGETDWRSLSPSNFCQRILPTAAASAAPTRSCFLPRESKSREELHREAERARV